MSYDNNGDARKSYILHKGESIYGTDIIMGDGEDISKCTRVWTDHHYWSEHIVNSYNIVRHNYDECNEKIVSTILKYNRNDSTYDVTVHDKLWIPSKQDDDDDIKLPLNVYDSTGEIVGEIRFVKDILHKYSRVEICFDDSDYITHGLLKDSIYDVEKEQKEEYFKRMESRFYEYRDGKIKLP